MTTALTVALPARPTMPAISPPCAPPLAAVRIGFGEDLLAVLRAALGATETPVQVLTGQPAGYLVAAEAWSGQRPPADVAETLCGLGDLDGRPVGLVVHA